MAVSFARLEKLVRDLHHHLDSSLGRPDWPVVILLHGLGGDCDDWMDPFKDRNWPYDHRRTPQEVDLGEHSAPPIGKLPGIETKYFLSPRLGSNKRGSDGSDDRSWWNALAKAGYSVLTYSQAPKLMMPLDQGPVAEFRTFMQILQQDVLSDQQWKARPVVLLGHSRGGLIGRAYLGSPEVKADRAGRFPRVTGLFTLSSPHQGSHMALMDDRIIRFLERVQNAVPKLPNDIGNQVINTLKAKADAYVGKFGDEIEPGSPMFRALEAQEPIDPAIRCISVAGTSPRLLRVYIWAFTPASLVPRKSEAGKVRFHWTAAPLEAKGASPVPDGLPLKLLGMDLEEVIPGKGDGLTAEKRCRFPASFRTEEHLTFPVSHAEELWDSELHAAIIQRLARPR